MPLFLILGAIIISAVTAKGFGDGEVAAFGKAAPYLRAERAASPRAFWCIVVFNAAVSLALFVGGVRELLGNGS